MGDMVIPGVETPGVETFQDLLLLWEGQVLTLVRYRGEQQVPRII